MTLTLRTAVAAMMVALLPQLVAGQDFEKFTVEDAGIGTISEVTYIATLDEQDVDPGESGLPVYESLNEDQGPESFATPAGGEGVLRSGSAIHVYQPQPVATGIPAASASEQFRPLTGLPAVPTAAIDRSGIETAPGFFASSPTHSSDSVSCDGDGACGGNCPRCRLFHLPKGPLPCGDLCSRCCPECCGVGTHYSSVYGGFLYLRARNADVAYGEPIDGPITSLPANNPIQVGSLGVVDPDYEPGYFGGVNLALDTVSSFDLRYTRFESQTSDQISTAAPNVIRSLVSHPSSTSAAADFLTATAALDIDFEQLDVAYRHLLACREVFAVNYVLGARYAKLGQEFNSNFVDDGTETVATDIDFEGAGVRIGLETDTFSCRNRLHLYARSYASFLAGRTRASYFQGQSFDPTVVNTDWEAGRIVPVLDLELGLGWTSSTGRVRLSGGYLVNAWFNTVKTEEFIRSVQNSDFLNLGDTLTFDGLSARAEYRF